MSETRDEKQSLSRISPAKQVRSCLFWRTHFFATYTYNLRLLTFFVTLWKCTNPLSRWFCEFFACTAETGLGFHPSKRNIWHQSWLKRYLSMWTQQKPLNLHSTEIIRIGTLAGSLVSYTHSLPLKWITYYSCRAFAVSPFASCVAALSTLSHTAPRVYRRRKERANINQASRGAFYKFEVR